MKNIALEFIKIIESHNYQAYIVGGFVRDYLMNISSNDIDITTNATPKQIKEIFAEVKFQKNLNDEDNYGTTQVIYKNILFEVTTFRKELDYADNRHPSKIIYINDLETDLKRRDFTINAICLNQEGKIIDPLDGQKDLKQKLIKTIINPNQSFKDDAIRILRAIRFAITLDFTLDKKLKQAILETKKYLKNISYERKRIELDKMFASINAKKAILYFQELELIDILELTNINRIKDYTDLIGIWSMINSKTYKFTKHERELIQKVNLAYELNNLDPLVLYKYGLYVNTLAGINKGLTKKEITKAYNNLPIKTRADINITTEEICQILKKKPASFLTKIINQLENLILTGKLSNDKISLTQYILNLKKTF